MAHSSVGVAALQESLLGCQLPGASVSVADGCLAFELKPVQAVFHEIVDAAVLQGSDTVFYGGHPFAALPGALPVVEVVHVGKGREARVGGVAEGKEAP